MSGLQLAASGPTAYWYTTRSTGTVALLLLTAALCLGIVDVRRWSWPSLPRFVLDSLHRNVSLLALAFVCVHVITSVLDTFAPISLTEAFVPFVGSYRPFWLGLGALSFDLMLAVIVTSLLRARLGFRTWRAVHWLSYASWPIALVHGFGTGSDVKSAWLMIVSVLCVVAVVTALLLRVLARGPGAVAPRRARGAVIAAAGGFSLFLALWLPSGPLGSEWARRAGTPSSLLHHVAAGRAQ
jgi:predicted ferric reductase